MVKLLGAEIVVLDFLLHGINRDRRLIDNGTGEYRRVRVDPALPDYDGRRVILCPYHNYIKSSLAKP